MVTRTKFVKATSLIPPSENIKDRSFTLFENDLYFIGDTSWFRIKNFMECDSNIVISYKSLSLAISIGGTIKGKRKSDYAIRFTNGKLKVEVSCNTASEAPEVKPLSDDDYTSVSQIFPSAKSLFGLVDKISMVSFATVDDRKCVVCASNRLLAVVSEEGEAGYDIDLTRIESVISSAITSKAKVCITNRRANFMIEESDFVVHSACGSMPASLSNNARSLISTVNAGGLEDNNEDEIITIDLDSNEILQMIPTADKIKSTALTMYYADGDMLKVRIEDMIGIVFEGNLKASTSGNLQFESRLIDKQMIDFLCGISKRDNNGMIRLSINVNERKLIIRPGTTMEGVNAFIVTGVNYKVWSTDDGQ